MRTAARAKGQSLDVRILGNVGANANNVRLRSFRRPADRQLAYLLRRRDIAIQQCRRQIGDCDIVEAVARLIRWKQRTCIHLQGKQVADGILIFRTIQPAKRLRPPGSLGGDWRCRQATILETRLLRRSCVHPVATKVCGGISRAENLRITFSQVSACWPIGTSRISSSTKPPVRIDWSWQLRQFDSTNRFSRSSVAEFADAGTTVSAAAQIGQAELSTSSNTAIRLRNTWRGSLT